MFKVTVGTKQGGELLGLFDSNDAKKTARGAIDEAAKIVETTADERVRFGLHEKNALGEWHEVFFVWGEGVEATAKEARAMDKKSRAGNGR